MLEQLFDRGFWDPWNELARLQGDVGRLFSPGALRRRSGYAAYPAVNVWADDNHVHLTAELPGVDPKDIDISVHDNTITLKGERKPEASPKGDWSTLRQERPFGTFARSLELPYHFDAEQVTAEYRNGVLELTLARSPKDQPRKITVKAN